MRISTSYLERIHSTLERALSHLEESDPESIEYDIYRHAIIKEFELLLEQCGKILRKALKAYGGNPKDIDRLFYKDVFRQCAKHGLVEVELVKRWFAYRDNRNNTAHDYGEHFVQETLSLLPQFMQDASNIIQTVNKHFKEDDNDDTTDSK